MIRRFAKLWWCASATVNDHRFSAVATKKHVAWQDLIEIIAVEARDQRAEKCRA
jgi:hypothetical protein